MDNEYKKMLLKMDYIIEQFYEIGEIAELTSFFPVMQYLDLQSNFEDFYHALMGASQKAADFNYKMAKENINSIYGKFEIQYADTDSVRVNSGDKESGNDADGGYDYKECHLNKIRDRQSGEHCKICPYLKNCFNGQMYTDD